MSENEWGREEGFRRGENQDREEVLSADVAGDDGDEAGLRPRRLDEFVGQTELKEHLGVLLDAARARGQTPDHLLFAGPPGLGKTTLAGIVAAELEVTMHVTSGPAIERAGDLAAILTNLADRDVLFIDEIHRLPKQVEEVLYPAMEDFQLDVVLGKGPAARSIRFDLPPFTLVGATTRTGLIAGPLRDRFGLVERLDYYDPGELQSIVERAAGILSVLVDSEGAAVTLEDKFACVIELNDVWLSIEKLPARVEGIDTRPAEFKERFTSDLKHRDTVIQDFNLIKPS